MRRNRRQKAEDEGEKLYTEEMTSKINHMNCPVCLTTFKNPAYLNCGHTFCEECIKKCPPMCPICREKIDKGSIHPDHLMKKIVDRLKVRCNNDLCKWVGQSDQVSKHLKICMYDPEYNIKNILEPRQVIIKSPQEDVDDELEAFIERNKGKMKDCEQKLEKALNCKLGDLNVQSMTEENFADLNEEFEFINEVLLTKFTQRPIITDLKQTQRTITKKYRQAVNQNRDVRDQTSFVNDPKISKVKKLMRIELNKKFDKCIYLKNQKTGSRNQPKALKSRPNKRFLSNSTLIKLASEYPDIPAQFYESYVKKSGNDLENLTFEQVSANKTLEKNLKRLSKEDKDGYEGSRQETGKELKKDILNFKRLIKNKIPQSHFPLNDMILLCAALGNQTMKFFTEILKGNSSEERNEIMKSINGPLTLETIESFILPTMERSASIFQSFVDDSDMSIRDMEGKYREFLEDIRERANQ